MNFDHKCEVCGETFLNGKIKSNHVRWKHKSAEFYKNTSERISDAAEKSLLKRRGSKKQFQVACNKCNKSFQVTERENDFPSKNKYFCSRGCANSHIVSKEHKEKTRRSIFKHLEQIGFVPVGIKTFKERKCSFCEQTFIGRRKFCSDVCMRNNKRKHLDKYQKYKRECQFNFALNQYPDEFDFNLIRKYGWYCAKNHGNHPNGVTRDHIISIRWAFENGIDSKYISHPANCQLMRQIPNVSKGKKKSITLDELIVRIKNWDQKYSSK
jgi:hypothetical protein